MDVPILRPLDVLLYRPSSVFGKLITWKTGHDISHVEVFLGRPAFPLMQLAQLDAKYGTGTQYITASRDGLGVDFYPLRTDHLAYVMRPIVPPTPTQIESARLVASSLVGTPYGWWDLADFFGVPVLAKGIVCSPYATVIARAAGYPLFDGTQPRLVAPYQFRTDELLSVVYDDGKDATIDAAPAVGV